MRRAKSFWPSAHAWFGWYIRQQHVNPRYIARKLAATLAGSELEFIFRDEMLQSGYYSTKETENERGV